MYFKCKECCFMLKMQKTLIVFILILCIFLTYTFFLNFVYWNKPVKPQSNYHVPKILPNKMKNTTNTTRKAFLRECDDVMINIMTTFKTRNILADKVLAQGNMLRALQRLQYHGVQAWLFTDDNTWMREAVKLGIRVVQNFDVDAVTGIPYMGYMYNYVATHDIHNETTCIFDGYVNGDILLGIDVVQTLRAVANVWSQRKNGVLVVGKRFNKMNTKKIVIESDEQLRDFGKDAIAFQEDAQDYFFISRAAFNWETEIPRFVVGRRAYDNWIVDYAYHSLDVDLIDATNSIHAIHETDKDGNHAHGGRLSLSPNANIHALNPTSGKRVSGKEWDHGKLCFANFFSGKVFFEENQHICFSNSLGSAQCKRPVISAQSSFACSPTLDPVTQPKETNFALSEPPKGTQMGKQQIEFIRGKLGNNGNLLVWGLGNDSPYWHYATHGRVVFIEDDIPEAKAGTLWFDVVTKKYPFLEAYKVHYHTDTKKSFERYIHSPNLWHELELKDLPDSVRNQNWDVIIIDAPLGCCGTGPGRYQSIYESMRLANNNTHIFVDDYERKVEKEFSQAVFGRPPTSVQHRDKGVSNANEQAYFQPLLAQYKQTVDQVINSILAPNIHYINFTYSKRGLTMQTREQLIMLQKQIENMIDSNVSGDVYETGTWRAGTSIFMVTVVRAYETLLGIKSTRHFYFFDSFEGFNGSNEKDHTLNKYLSNANYKAHLDTVRASFRDCGIDPDDSNIHFIKGYFEDTMKTFDVPRPISILRLDGDLYSSTKIVLERLYPFVNVGGWVIVDDYDWRPTAANKKTKLCREAIDEFRSMNHIASPLTKQYGIPSWKIEHATIPLIPTKKSQHWVILLTVNNGFFDFFQNWWLFFEKLNMTNKVVVVAEDDHVYQQLQNYSGILLDKSNLNFDGSHSYNTKKYKEMVSTRPKHILKYLEMGNDILYTDIDTVWLADPTIHINAHPRDIVAQLDGVDYKGNSYYCTGFMAIKSNKQTINFMKRWNFELKHKAQLNQPVFNRLIYQSSNVTHTGLPRNLFPDGKQYFEVMKDKTQVVVVHNNYIIGHDKKKARFEKAHLWKQNDVKHTYPVVEIIPEKGHFKSQAQEDRFLWENMFYGKQNGTFLEMGALDGVTFSNTYMFEKSLGWNGILIEGDPENFAKLKQNRKSQILVNAAVCSKKMQVHYVTKGLGPVRGIWEFMEEDFRKRWHKKIDMKMLPTVECIPIVDVLKNYSVKHFNLWSLDVEGSELEVLKTMNFTEYTFDVILVESYHQKERIKEKEKFQKVKDFILNTKLYYFYGPVAENDVFVSNNFTPRKKHS